MASITQFILFIVVLLVIYPMSLLPMWALYGISNVIAFTLRKILKYRYKVVIDNLKSAFPEKSDKEINAIVTKYYAHLADIIVETIKTFSISKRQIKDWVKEENPELIQKFYAEGKSVVAISGHFNNWEWAALRFNMTSKHQAIGIYKKISNPYFNRLMKWSRERHGVKFIEAKEVFNFFKTEKNPFIIGFLSDQWPSKAHAAYWTTFLNRETAVYPGAEKYAVEYDLPVIYGIIEKVSRGKYLIKYQLITIEPGLEKSGFISEAHIRLLEKSIVKKPEYWIWSHKRWKKDREEIMQMQLKSEITNQ